MWKEKNKKNCQKNDGKARENSPAILSLNDNKGNAIELIKKKNNLKNIKEKKNFFVT